jgi:hypothetical protein
MKTQAKDFFLWAATVLSLYVSVISLLALWFEYIDRLFGEQIIQYYAYSTGIQTALATLIVIFPAYIFCTRLLHSDLRKNPEKKDLWVRKWLLVGTLFVGSATIVIDLIVLITTFLSGEELTTSFLLKVFSILIVIGSALIYYIKDINGYWDKREKISQFIGGFVSVIVVGSIIGAFFIIGSPQTQRLMRIDDQKINDLQNIQYQITDYWQNHAALPANFTDLDNPLTGWATPTDPQFESKGYAYSYAPIGEHSFKLCAVFNLENSDKREDMYYSRQSQNYWNHAAGEVCFERTIDEQEFPVRTEAKK